MGGILGLMILVLDIVAIIDALKSSTTIGRKALWVVLIVVVPIMGLVLYFLIGRKKAV
jgi:succinate dehydrogenase/fumarate reductase cytochrome b subunit